MRWINLHPTTTAQIASFPSSQEPVEPWTNNVPPTPCHHPNQLQTNHLSFNGGPNDGCHRWDSKYVLSSCFLLLFRILSYYWSQLSTRKHAHAVTTILLSLELYVTFKLVVVRRGWGVGRGLSEYCRDWYRDSISYVHSTLSYFS